MKALRKTWMLVVAVVITAIGIGCKNTVEVDKKGDEVAPAKVTNLTATAKDTRVLLTWTDAADSDIYGYEVSYSGIAPINRVVLPALNSAIMMAAQGAGGSRCWRLLCLGTYERHGVHVYRKDSRHKRKQERGRNGKGDTKS